MDANSSALVNDSGQDHVSDPVADPFAGDFFAINRPAPEAPATGPERAAAAPAVETAWHSRLPRLTRREAARSSMLARLAAGFGAAVSTAAARLITRLCQIPAPEASIHLVQLREDDLVSPRAQSEADHRVFGSFEAGPEAGRVGVELDLSFAAALIDLMLGGEGAPLERLRPLTATERAVLEFGLLSLARQINETIGESLIRLGEVTQGPPVWLAGDAAGAAQAAAPRGLIAAASVKAGGLSGTVRCYLTAESIAALNGAYFAPSGPSDYQRWLERVAQYRKIVPEAGLSLIVGETGVALGDLARLECGDVVVVERHMMSWRDGEISGEVRVRVGDADSVIIAGKVIQAPGPLAEDQARPLSIKVDIISVGDVPTEVERWRMSTEPKHEETIADGAVILDGMLVTVHVELAARRARLDELAQLRHGQVLELGCAPTDPVDLIVDGRRIARGELVDIEGRLGVRITQVASQI
jgi:flagellar motor switch/type III secretory pathway protein FliN